MHKLLYTMFIITIYHEFSVLYAIFINLCLLYDVFFTIHVYIYGGDNLALTYLHGFRFASHVSLFLPFIFRMF